MGCRGRPGRAWAHLPDTGTAVILADHDWVHFTPPSGLADVLDAACAGAGFCGYSLDPDKLSSSRTRGMTWRPYSSMLLMS